jgi:hypothetical protein
VIFLRGDIEKEREKEAQSKKKNNDKKRRKIHGEILFVLSDARMHIYVFGMWGVLLQQSLSNAWMVVSSLQIGDNASVNHREDHCQIVYR